MDTQVIRRMRPSGAATAARLSSAFILAACALLAGTAARAESIVLADTGLIVGNGTADFSMNLPGPGTVYVTLTDLAWASPFSSLTFSATSASNVLDTMSGPGNGSFSVSSGGEYYAHISAQAQGALDLGVYSLDVMFNPMGSPVFLPASVWMLLGGLAAIAGLLRMRTTLPANSTSVATPVHG